MSYFTATIKSSFRTLRSVKPWLRSTIDKDRINGILLHIKFVNVMGESFTETS